VNYQGVAYRRAAAGTSGATFVVTNWNQITPNLSAIASNITGIPNAGLTNSSVTVNGSAIALGGSATVTAVATNALTLGSGLSGTSFNGSAAVTAAVDSTIPRLTADQTFTGLQTLVTSAAGNKGLIVKGSASQSVNLQEWQDSAGTVKAGINLAGRAFFNATASSSSAYLFVGGNNTTVAQQELQAAASQTADIARLLNSAGTTIGGRNALAQIYTGSTTPLTTAVGGATTATSGTGSTATVTLTSAPNVAVGDLITVAGVTPTGYNATAVVTAVSNTSPYSVSYANTTTGAQTVAGTVSAPAQASITARSAGTTGLIVRAAASAANNIQEWQGSSGGVLSRIASDGLLYAAQVRTTNSYTRLLEGNAGGQMVMVRATAAQGNPGANLASLYFRDGTTTGTLKLVVRAGAAGAETTILDNIPQ
jgi:hypothetical protein